MSLGNRRHFLPLELEALLRSHVRLENPLDRETGRLAFEHSHLPQTQLHLHPHKCCLQLSCQRRQRVLPLTHEVKGVEDCFLLACEKSCAVAKLSVQGAKFVLEGDCFGDLNRVGERFYDHELLQVVHLGVSLLKQCHERNGVDLAQLEESFELRNASMGSHNVDELLRFGCDLVDSERTNLPLPFFFLLHFLLLVKFASDEAIYHSCSSQSSSQHSLLVQPDLNFPLRDFLLRLRRLSSSDIYSCDVEASRSVRVFKLAQFKV